MSDTWPCPWCGGEMTDRHFHCEKAVTEEYDLHLAALAEKDAEIERLREVIVTRWEGFRPKGWNTEDHLEHPHVNTSSGFDKDLATAAVEIARAALDTQE